MPVLGIRPQQRTSASTRRATQAPRWERARKTSCREAGNLWCTEGMETALPLRVWKRGDAVRKGV
jgi:hypothetical protein